MSTHTQGGTRRLHITHVILQLRTGGMEKVLAEFARHADRQRFHLRFVCIGEHGPVADEIAACGWDVKCLGYAPGLKLDLVTALGREFIRGRADVVHTHNSVPLIFGGPAARLARGIPLLQTRHGQAVGRTCRHRTAVRLAALLAQRVVCVSEDARRVAAAEGIAERRLAVIRNGIDTTRFAYRGPANGGPVVAIGRLVPLKGIDLLLRAVAEIVRQRPDFRLEIAGDGPARPGLEQITRELGLNQHVRFLGEVRDIPALLARASLLVLPSLSEGISLTLLEAMACGLPIVATRVGGTPEVVTDGVTGRLVEPSDPSDLARGILTMWPASEDARAMGTAAREQAVRYFDVRRMVSEYESMYLQLARPRAVARVPAPQSRPEPHDETPHHEVDATFDHLIEANHVV